LICKLLQAVAVLMKRVQAGARARARIRCFELRFAKHRRVTIHSLLLAQIGLFLYGRDCVCAQVSTFPIGGSIMETGYLYASDVSLESRQMAFFQARFIVAGRRGY